LFLDRTPVTDAGVKELTALKQLKILGLCESKVTEAGAKNLRTSLPECRITK
jgi:hypothetical protein